MTKEKVARQARRRARRTAPEKEPPRVEFISTGCHLLNLAASQKSKEGGWGRGRIVNVVGDKSSGKTILCVETAAWYYYNLLNQKSQLFSPKKHHVVYNNIEGVMDFPLEEMYGKEFVNAVEWIHSETAEEFGRDVHKRITDLPEGESLLYVLDSLDALVSEAAAKRTAEAAEKGKTEDGSYGTEKAKYFSQSFFNYLCKIMEGKDVTLMLVSQVREKLNAGPFEKKVYRTGGRALDFYSHQVVWLFTVEKMDVERKKKKVTYGVKTRAKFEKNKVAMPFRTADFRILFDYGIDDINTMIDYVFGPKKNEAIEIDGEKYKRSELVEACEEDSEMMDRLIGWTEEIWFDVENAAKTKRKKKYGGAG